MTLRFIRMASRFVQILSSFHFLICLEQQGHAKGPYPEPNYSGDFGDFKSFVLHMKEKAIHDNVDLLLVDSGSLLGYMSASSGDELSTFFRRYS